MQYKTFRFNKYSVDIGQHFGTAQERVNEFIEKNRKFISLGFNRSYMFLGPPGSGKSTMSQHFARAYSNRILQISPEVIWNVGDIDIIKLIEESGANVVLIDELDKLMSQLGQQHKGMLLSRIEKMRKCKPGLITIITANSVKNFPDAMLRPGRIDDIIEFTHPDEEDRKKILQGYANLFDVAIGPDVINRVAGISEGLTGAWLKEVVMQMKVSDPDAACALIEKMLKYAKSKED
jgi:SpoVK/Ycf46/Vps4 family AAA+-type ATPase